MRSAKDPSFGVTTAKLVIAREKALRSKPPKPPAKAPAPSDVSAPQILTELSRSDQRLLTQQLVAFRSRLSSEGKTAFSSFRRLTPSQRDALLSTMSKDQIASRGLRFSDEPTEFNDNAKLAAKRKEMEARLPPTTRVETQTVLMFLWFTADPLWLDLTIDAHHNGINMGHNGAKDKTYRAPNMAREGLPLKAMVDGVLKDIKEGRATGFFPRQPFTHVRCVPLGAVPKEIDDEGTVTDWRVVAHYSSGKSKAVSTNGTSDHVEAPFPGADRAIESFTRAGAGSFSLKWDIKGAYPVMRIRIKDRWLTCSYIVGRGWCYRNCSPFGAAVAGFRWEVCGGRMLSTILDTLSPRLRVSSTDSVALLPDISFTADDEARMLIPPPGGFCQLSDNDVMLHAHGKKRLEEIRRIYTDVSPEDKVDVQGSARWVDDFYRAYNSFAAAYRAGVAVSWMHAAIKMPLKKEKWSLAQLNPFGGIDLDGAKYTAAVPPDKRKKALQCMGPWLAPRDENARKRSLKDHQRLVYLLVFFVRAYPAGKHFLTELFQDLNAAQARVNEGKATPTDPTIVPSEGAIRQLLFWKRACTEGPITWAPFVRSMHNSPDGAEAVIHCDWAGKTNQVAAYSLVKGTWATHVLPEGLGMPPPTVTNQSPDHSSSAKEIWSMVFALYALHAEVRGKNVALYNDNEPAIIAIESYTSDKPAVVKALEAFALAQITLNCHARLFHVPSGLNLADKISRNDTQAFFNAIGKQGLSAACSPVALRLKPPLTC
jgi:hypothetical protein